MKINEDLIWIFLFIFNTNKRFRKIIPSANVEPINLNILFIDLYQCFSASLVRHSDFPNIEIAGRRTLIFFETEFVSDHFIWRFAHRSFYQKVPADRNFTSIFFVIFWWGSNSIFVCDLNLTCTPLVKSSFGNEKSIKISQITVDARMIAELKKTKTAVI